MKKKRGDRAAMQAGRDKLPQGFTRPEPRRAKETATDSNLHNQMFPSPGCQPSSSVYEANHEQILSDENDSAEKKSPRNSDNAVPMPPIIHSNYEKDGQ